MADLPFPFNATILRTYDLLQNDAAYNKGCVEETDGVRSNISLVSEIMDAMGLPELGSHSSQLATYSDGILSSLKGHLENHFEHLPTNLGVMSGYINDLAALSRLPGYNHPASVSLLSTTSMSSGGKCGSMADAFGSIMGKASEFMGALSGGVGQLGGILGGLLGGGVLGAVQQFANLSGLSNIPGINQIGSLMGGLQNGNLGSLGQIGSLISNIGRMANINDLGQLGTLIGGDLSKLVNVGDMLQSMAGAMNQSVSYQGIGNTAPALSGIGELQDALSVVRLTQVSESLNSLAVKIISASGVPGIGDVEQLSAQLGGIADLLDAPGGLQQVPDVTETINNLSALKSRINSLTPSQLEAFRGRADIPGILSGIDTALSDLGTVNNMAGFVGNLGTVRSSLEAFGGQTGFGNLGQLQGRLSGVLGKMGALNGTLGNMLPIGNVMQQLQGVMGSVTNLMGMGGHIGSMTSLLGQFQGLLGSLGSGLGGILGALGTGPLGGLMGALGGVMGQVGSIMGQIGAMIGAENAMLGSAMSALQRLAGSFNLKQLFSQECAREVLDNVGSPALLDTLSGGAGGGSSGPGIPLRDGDINIPPPDVPDVPPVVIVPDQPSTQNPLYETISPTLV